ncbi:MAG: protein kinase [Candidatus Brachytrichaceae bacterium NZ_4S206]
MTDAPGIVLAQVRLAMTQAALSLASFANVPAPLVGSLLDGRYVIERQLGEGGMGLVYAARHHVLGRRFAIKVLRPEVSRDAGVITRFRREAQAASAIGSPHICDVSDFGVLPDGSTYFVMEYLDGPSLTEVMEAGPIELPRLLGIGMQLCDALGAAHARGIVHRDLKPDNVHLVRRGEHTDFVKVLDFGIAKVMGGSDKRLTQAGQVFGTPYYMSPEQCIGSDVDHRTDLYALGVILYEMASGQVPFEAESLVGVLTKQLHEAPPALRDVSPVPVSPVLEAVILKCLAKSPDERYASMEALRADLEALREGSTPSVRLPSAPLPTTPTLSVAAAAPTTPLSVAAAAPKAPTTTPRATSAPRTGLGLAIGAMLGLVLVGGAVGAVFLRTSRAPAATPPVERAPRVEVRPPEEVAPVVREERAPAVESPVVGSPPEVREPASPNAAPPSLVQLRTEPPGAEVYAGGALIGNTPLALPRPAEGISEIRVVMPGYREHTLSLGPQTSDELSITLERRVERSHASPRVEPRALTPTVRPLGGPRSSVGQPTGDGLIDPFGARRR